MVDIVAVVLAFLATLSALGTVIFVYWLTHRSQVIDKLNMSTTDLRKQIVVLTEVNFLVYDDDKLRGFERKRKRFG